MHTRSVLISGASIAGPALAFWLRQHGMRPVIVERAPRLRGGGQSVDIRGAGRAVARRMGIETAIRGAGTGEQGIAFVDANGRARVRIPAQAFGGEGPVAELEILRGELSRILYEQTCDTCEYIFDNQVTALADKGEHVHASFLHGPDRQFDVVVAADGIRSRTRQLIFADDVQIHPLGLYMAYFTIPRHASDPYWARWHNAPGGRVVLLRPDNLGTTRAMLSFLSPPRGFEAASVSEQKQLLQRVFADVGWEAPRVLAALENTDEFYFEAIGQVRMPRWSRGRVALVGDAAYCASPISGMGTSLALVGAYILAGELAHRANPHEAFSAYETLMRPYVTQAQKLLPGAPRTSCPKTRAGIALVYAVLRVATVPGVRQILGRLFKPPAESISLPNYEVSDNKSAARAASRA